MEARGWLYKRTTGRIITWKKRYFVLDKNCVMTQFKNDITSSSSPKSKPQPSSSFQVTGFSENIGSNIKIPKQFDQSLGILLNTSNPKSPQRIILASNIQEKRLWINSLASCLRKEANFDVRSIVELGDTVNKEVELNRILRSLRVTPPISLDGDTRKGEEKLTKDVRNLICAFVGNLVDVVKLSVVSRAWQNAIGFRRHNRKQPSIFSWIVRHGEPLSQDLYRWYFWQLLTENYGENEINIDAFDEYSNLANDFVKFEIKKDVDRAFGVTDKRATQRRTISLSRSMSEEECNDSTNRRTVDFSSNSLFSLENRIVESFNSDDEGEEDENLPQRPIIPSELSQRNSLLDTDVSIKKESLTSILEALAGRFPSVGYCQGIDRVVVHVMRASRTAVSLASLSCDERGNRTTINRAKEVECFAFLTSLFESLSLTDVYARDGVSGLRMRMWQLARLFEYHCPELYKTLENEGMTLDVFCIGWVQTLFLYIEAMPAHTIDRIWDIMIFESSWVIIFQVSVALVKLSYDSLKGMELDEIVLYFNNFPDASILEPEKLIVAASQINLNEDILDKLKHVYENMNS